MPSTNSSSEDSYFTSSASGISTSNGSFVSTPNGSVKATLDEFVSEAPIHPLPPLEREFSKPAEEINVSEALAREPGRWSIQGQRDANRRREEQAIASHTEDGDARTKALQDAKNQLLAAYAEMSSKSSN